MITSVSNAQVKNVVQLLQKSKARKKQGLFVVEGWKMCREMPDAWMKAVYVTEEFYENMSPQHKETYAEKGILEIVSDPVFQRMSDAKTPQGILAIVAQPEYTLEETLCGEKPLMVVLEDLQDPGNVGTILRTAEGAGVSGILLSRQCADLFSPKTVRSTMGSIYRMPFCYADNLAETLEKLKRDGYAIYAADLAGARDYDQADYTDKAAILIGNEGNGLSGELLALADKSVRIPMEGGAESLNAAMAAGILMYEAARQRRWKKEKNI